MIDARIIILLAVLLGGAGVWQMLPRGAARGRATGAVLAAASLGLFASQLPGWSDWVAGALFYVLAGVTLASAACTISFRSPVYAAIWFGMSLLGTAGLFLTQGAQFLAVATVVVYAGAILVTFLFVLMLAEPTGRAHYDRVSWEALVSASCGAAFVGVLTATLLGVVTVQGDYPGFRGEAREDRTVPFGPPGRLVRPGNLPGQTQQGQVLADEHVKALGDALFGRHLIAVQVAGVLLLAALVGAAVIVGRSRGPLVGPPAGPPHGALGTLPDHQGPGGDGHA
ncbi:MAG: NADH-quinone oxidoreductase subunit J [Thermoguttaceae bacterium]|nr:NADH-quinone oxidoreductase subunit J [Thermoguttaceae bacterium]